MSRPETYDIEYQEPGNDTPWIIPIGKGTPEERIPAVIDGYVRTMKARLKNKAIIADQAKKYPTSAELAGKPGSVAPQPAYQNVYPSGPESRTTGEVATDQAANVLSGVPKAITGIPGTVATLAKTAADVGTSGALPFLNPKVGQDMAGIAQGMTQPAAPIAKTIAGNPPPPESPEWSQAAQAAGTMLAGAELPNALEGAGALAQAGMRKLTPPPVLEKAAANNIAKALQPSSLESKAVVEQIAPELAKRGVSGLTGRAIDADIMSKLQEATDNLNAVEKRVITDPRPEYQVAMKPIREQIDASIAKLKKYPKINSDSISAMEDIRDSFAQLPDYAPIKDAIELRRTLDDAVRDSGGFKQASSTADRVKMRVQRGAGDLLRSAINEVDPELKLANREYSLYQNAADIVDRRKLGNVGASDSGLPNRGGLLDDIIAGWTGRAIAGAPGMAVAEGLNLARQTRGAANVKAKFQQQLADILKRPLPPPRGLLTSGSPALEAPETSGVTGSAAEPAPATREIRTGRLLGPGLPLPPGSEPPSGGHSLSVTTGEPTYVSPLDEILSGRRLKK